MRISDWSSDVCSSDLRDGGDLGRIVADIIKSHSTAPADELADRVIAQLARLNVASTYWPGDDEIRKTLAFESAFRRYPRARLRAFLEAIENSYRAETKQPQVERAGLDRKSTRLNSSH